MNDLHAVGRLLLTAGLLLTLAGAVILLGPRLPFLGWIGRLPGDLVFRRGPVTIYAPLLTSILLSLLFTLALNLFLRR